MLRTFCDWCKAEVYRRGTKVTVDFGDYDACEACWDEHGPPKTVQPMELVAPPGEEDG